MNKKRIVREFWYMHNSGAEFNTTMVGYVPVDWSEDLIDLFVDAQYGNWIHERLYRTNISQQYRKDGTIVEDVIVDVKSDFEFHCDFYSK